MRWGAGVERIKNSTRDTTAHVWTQDLKRKTREWVMYIFSRWREGKGCDIRALVSLNLHRGYILFPFSRNKPYYALCRRPSHSSLTGRWREKEILFPRKGWLYGSRRLYI